LLFLDVVAFIGKTKVTAANLAQRESRKFAQVALQVLRCPVLRTHRTALLTLETR